jgi:quinol monooxygenase YgiN
MRNGNKPEGEIEMIKVVAKNYIKADKVEEFIILARHLVQETNRADAGCISYELFQDTSNPQILTIIEEWKNKESLEQHMQAKHFKEASAAFKDFIESPGEVNFYQKLT